MPASSSPWPREVEPDVGRTTAPAYIEAQLSEYSTPGFRSNTQPAYAGEARMGARKPTPSPLQVSETFSMAADCNGHSSPRNPRSPTAISPGTIPLSSPHSPRSPRLTDLDQPKSPRDKLDELIATEGSISDGGIFNIADGGSIKGPASAPAKANSYHQLRNVSSPGPLSKSLGSSPPASPIRTASTPFTSTTVRPDLRSMPRTSSIDSAISTISSATSHSHKSSQDSVMSNTTDIAHLINTAGSAEALIQHLLREKQHSATQNAQLWKLVDKQRTLVLGLNQDLERALKDKERYRKKLKEHLAQAPPLPNTPAQVSRLDVKSRSRSPTRNSSSDGTPIQRNKDRDTVILRGNNDNSNLASSYSSKEATDDIPMDSAREDKADFGTSDAPSKIALSESQCHQAGMGTSIRAVAPIETTGLDRFEHRTGGLTAEAPIQQIDSVVSPSSFTAKRSLSFAQKATQNPALQLTESTPPNSANERGQPPRRFPPAPLNLRPSQSEPQYGPEDHSGSEYEDNAKVDDSEMIERGRKKTREEDDREREAALLKEQENRSRSKKSKGSKAPTDVVGAATTTQLSMPPTVKSLAPETASADISNHLATPASLASVLSPPETQTSTIKSKTLTALPMSPGLPISPRPMDRPMLSPTPRMPRDAIGASPPISPRNGFVGLPLSPRAPRQPIPLPPQTPMSIVSPMSSSVEPRDDADIGPQDHVSPQESTNQPHPDPEKIGKSEAEILRPTGIFRGFVSESYPDLLIPPNALPSINVKVNSSRLKPSRLSYLGHKSFEEDPVFTLGVSARSDLRELWQVEKPLLSLLQLDHQIKKTTAFDARLPDRSLFSGHAPAKIDARRVALERYFETILDTPMDEQAAIAVCKYLSSQPIEPANNEDTNTGLIVNPGSLVKTSLGGRLVKEGYLTKRGKNFGGWKARYFVLDEPILRYYEYPGGSLLGTIKLKNAQIGKQSAQTSSHSPSRNSEDMDSQYRHAFLILEPKRKDSNSHVRHVLCAESDAERDVWVQALLSRVEGPHAEDKVKPPPLNVDSSSSKAYRKQMAKNDGMYTDSPDSETFEGLQAVSYENTVPAQPPTIAIAPQRVDTDSPSPPFSVNQNLGRPSHAPKPISGPSNGVKIEDAGAWGNKVAQAKDFREPRKRGIWGFRDKNNDSAPLADDPRLSVFEPPVPIEVSPNVRPAFGIPLADAVKYCSPEGLDVCLPAVVYRCLEYLQAQGAASEEGIFRLSGSSIVIKGLRDRFNTQGDFDFLADGQYYDIHAVASLLKLYLRELPSTVLTRELHLDFLAVLELDSKSKKVAAYNTLVHRLPKANWTLIRALSVFLINIVNNSEINKMSVRNVGIVFSPTLNIPAPVFAMFLTEFEAIFGEEPKEPVQIPTEVTVNEPLTPEDIRSPRRQMFSEIPTPSYQQSNFPQNPSHAPTSGPHQPDNDTGLVPMQPSYETQIVPGPEPGVVSRGLAPDSAVKARRRESSMLLMGGGQRKSSIPLLRGNTGMWIYTSILYLSG